MLALEREIAQYRRENDALRRARKEHEDSKAKLDQEQEKFRRYTENEKRRLALLYSEEQKRVRAEHLKDLVGSNGEVSKKLHKKRGIDCFYCCFRKWDERRATKRTAEAAQGGPADQGVQVDVESDEIAG